MGTADINHLAWFLEWKRGDEDLYPRLRELVKEPEKLPVEAVRFELMKQFGYFPTESSGHDSEYLPYFRTSQAKRQQYNRPSRIVPETAPVEREWAKDGGADGSGKYTGELTLSNEYASGIMEAVVTNEPYRFNGNVMNTGLITNLPRGCCVEVPCMADAGGIHPCHVGELPKGVAALCRSNVSVQDLAVQAVLDRDREAAFHAVAVCPMTAAVLTLPKIREMFDEMWEAEKHLLTWFDEGRTGPVPEICAE